MSCFRLLSLFCLCGFFVVSACDSDDDSKMKKAPPSQPDNAHGAAVPINPQTLLNASLTGKMEYVQKALEQDIAIDHTDREGRTPLMLASYNGHADVVRYLLEHGANPHAKDNRGRTPLIFAASGPFPKTVTLLLDHGAHPDDTDKDEGWSAIMWAAAEGNQQVVRLLLKRGADPTLKDKDQETARDFAAGNGHRKIVDMLEQAENEK